MGRPTGVGAFLGFTLAAAILWYSVKLDRLGILR